MDKKPDIFKILTEKTQKDLDLFVANSYISVDEQKRKDFYSLVQRIIVETSISRNTSKENMHIR